MSESTFQVPIGPQHPALKEPENFLLTVDGEQIIDAKIRLGYVHRGGEKALENRTYVQGMYLVERICGICAMAHQLCYVNNLESMMDIEVPPRAHYIRTVVAELERIHSHLLWLGVAAHEIGFDTMFMYVWRDREHSLDLMEMMTGNRVLHAANTLGGVRRDITPEMMPKLKKGAAYLRERAEYYKKLCLAERTILKRALGVGILPTKDAIELCAVGPTTRASNVKRDVRKYDPYSVYDEIPFNLITYDLCDVAARVLVRIDEVIEAANIIEYAIDHLPSGPIGVKAPRSIPQGESVSLVEAPRGEDIHYCKSNGTDKPERYKVRAPTLGNWASMRKMLIGGYVADVPIVIAAIDPCMSCTDRVAFIDANSGKNWVWSTEQIKKYSKKNGGR
jgi:membrane-bound hydrogenase subunit alpha